MSSGTDDGGNLERRYRALLRLLPAGYRAERGEEMTEVFLAGREDDLDREHGWPGWSEAAATVALAARLRLGDTRAGAAVRLVAFTGLLAHTLLAVQEATTTLRANVPVPAADLLVLALAPLALVALLTGRPTTAALTATAAAALGLPLLAAEGPALAWALLTQAAAWTTAAALWAGHRREAPGARWSVAAATATTAWTAWCLLAPPVLAYHHPWLLAAATTALAAVAGTTKTGPGETPDPATTT
ncbi:hypothetical protein [Actinosynnema pretiosum]|uniref:Uncharacterized protein n=1 Tax=Actinosynnema pretiosum TaxID=42197 RepID=A0A290Z741_9PSEU|nr:hypothetical protein [Actinosynnema pretiosum]ATE54818.1 hypothetical protein CNX65_17290 [Actinosynnema pretiosum]